MLDHNNQRPVVALTLIALMALFALGMAVHLYPTI
jgi:hypothetical protein